MREGLLSLEAVTKRFGDEVAKLIDGVLKYAISYPLAPNHEPAQPAGKPAQNAGEYGGRRVALIKIAERTRALRRQRRPREKCLQVAREVVPLAHRLGIGQTTGNWKISRFIPRGRVQGDCQAAGREALDRDRYIRDVVETLKA